MTKAMPKTLKQFISIGGRALFVCGGQYSGGIRLRLKLDQWRGATFIGMPCLRFGAYESGLSRLTLE